MGNRLWVVFFENSFSISVFGFFVGRLWFLQLTYWSVSHCFLVKVCGHFFVVFTFSVQAGRAGSLLSRSKQKRKSSKHW